ncbi:MAG: YetF domain-containing protein [Clostridium sp.]
MFILFIRTILLYFLVILAVRLMGKRQIGELQPYEFVITIMISDLAMLPMQDVKLPLVIGIIPILTLLLLKLILSQLQLKSQFARRLLDGEPAILIYKSKINYNALKIQQINLDELMEEIRIAGFFDLEDIQYAILETNGDLSILPKPQQSNDFSDNKESTSTPRTMSGTDSKDDIFLPKILISDGKINTNSLTRVNKDPSWIKNKLKEYNISDISTVLIAFFDTKGNFKYQLFDDYENLRRKDSKNEK